MKQACVESMPRSGASNHAAQDLDRHRHYAGQHRRLEAGPSGPDGAGATLVGLAIVDEPGIRAIEPAWPVGGQPTSTPSITWATSARLADVHEEAQRAPGSICRAVRRSGVAHAEVKRVGSPHEQIQQEAQAATSSCWPVGHGSASLPGTTKPTTPEEGFERHSTPRGGCARRVAGRPGCHRL